MKYPVFPSDGFNLFVNLVGILGCGKVLWAFDGFQYPDGCTQAEALPCTSLSFPYHH